MSRDEDGAHTLQSGECSCTVVLMGPVLTRSSLIPSRVPPVSSYTDPQVSMDLLRAVLQPSFNDDIMAVFRKYQKVRGHTVGSGPRADRCGV